MRASFKVLAAGVGVLVLSQGQLFAQPISANPSVTAQPAAPAVKTVFDYQQELGLSDKQVTSLKALLAELQTKMGDAQKKIGTLRQELAASIQSKADIKAIRKSLEKISAAQVDATIVDIDTSRKVEAILTADQMNKWKDIQAKFREEMQAQAQAAQAAEAAPAEVKAPEAK